MHGIVPDNVVPDDEKNTLLLSAESDRWRKVRNFLAFQLLARTANLIMLVIVAIFGFILWRSLPFLTSGGIGRLAEPFLSGKWFPDARPPEFGMLALFYGSFVVTFVAMAIAAPVGILSAVALSDMVSFRIRRFLKPFIELLAAIPSVAFGFFAIKIVAPWLQDTFGFSSGTNALNAALILAVMALPTIVSVAEDAVSGIGRELREASHALGATRAETLLQVVIPASRNGITAALILGTMRAVGETMVVWMAAGNAANMPSAWYRVDQVVLGLGDAVRTITATIAGDMGEAPAESLHRSALFTVALFLLLFTFCMNILTEYVSRNRRHGDIGRPNATAGVLSMLYGRVADALGDVSPILMFGQKRSYLLRRFFDNAFTAVAYASIAALFFALVIVLFPIFRSGVQAVFFRETVEHRLFLWERFERGDRERIQKEFDLCANAREPIYRQLRQLSWLTPDDWIAEAGKIARTSGSRKSARAFKRLCEAGSQEELAAAWERMEIPDTEIADARGDLSDPLLRLAKEYHTIARDADLSLRQQATRFNPDLTCAAAFRQIRTLITGEEGTGCILGPSIRDYKGREGMEHLPPEVRYGPAHWSSALRYLSQLKEAVVWEHRFDSQGNVLPGEKRIVDRTSLFAGTSLHEPIQKLIDALECDLEKMHRPRLVFYGNYFFDSSSAGHYLGGIGPELLGTAAVAVFSILFALPLGIVTAAYLVEAAKESRTTRLLRLCISTLAGVPSIVFGLFGLAVIVELVTGKPCLLAGSITLAILILPVIIRTGEEAIRAVPQTYREAAAGLGAGPAWTFFSVTLPASLPGILTGTILGVSRAAGETAPLLFTCAVASGGFLAGADFLMQPTPVLSYAAYDMAVGDRLAEMVPYNQYGLVSTLILFVLLLNVAAIVLRGRITSKLKGI
ncbi:MAG TPA: hypothetical protein DEB39_03045 [Planctomycetaceae bacterium]|nr:hypothetical protein [Planctomycetaceae bacterium]